MRSLPKPSSPWRPMGTEPKDGTPFLVWRGAGVVLSASWYCQILCHQYPYATRADFWMRRSVWQSAANAGDVP